MKEQGLHREDPGNEVVWRAKTCGAGLKSLEIFSES